MSDTPRTDAEEWDADLDMVVDSDFARTLERELAEARKALVWFWQHLDRVLLNAGYLRPQIPDEHGHALRQARDAVDRDE